MSTGNKPQTRGRIDDRSDSSTSRRETPPQSRIENVPEPLIKAVSKRLGSSDFPKDGDDDAMIQVFLGHVWMDVKLASSFSNDQKLEKNLADMEEFFANVKLKGEWEFIDSLKAMAASGDWAGLFDDGTSSFSFYSKYSDQFLH
jgi:hypothetical protein